MRDPMTHRSPRLVRSCTAALLALAASGSVASAQPRPDADWPCAQRKVATLGSGAVWTGPDLAAAGDWGTDRDAAQLARKLASRRTELKEVDALLDEFTAKTPDKAERDTRLTRVFAGVFEVVNGERSTIVNGISRYAQGQRRLAERIRDEADRVSAAKDSPAQAEGAEATTDAQKASAKQAADLETQFNWDRRIFEERNGQVSYVCEVPQLLEQRLGDLARKIQSRL